MNMHQKIFAVIATLAAISLVVIVALAPRAAHAQGMNINVAMSCNKSEIVLQMLHDKYKEQVAGGGVTPGGGHIRLFVSETDSFTVIVTSPDGISCIMTGGENWTTQTSKPRVDGKDS